MSGSLMTGISPTIILSIEVIGSLYETGDSPPTYFIRIGKFRPHWTRRQINCQLELSIAYSQKKESPASLQHFGLDKLEKFNNRDLRTYVDVRPAAS